MGPEAGQDSGNMGSRGAATIWRVHFAMVVVQLCITGSLILSKIAVTSGLNPIVFTLYRDIVGVIFLANLAYFAERGQRPALDGSVLAQFVLLGFVGIFVGQSMFIFGIALAPVAFGPLVSAMVPILVFIISTTFGLEVVQWRQRAGLTKVGGVISACVGGLMIPLYRGPVIVGSALYVHTVPLPEFEMDAHGLLEFPLRFLKIEKWQLGGILLTLAALCLAIYFNLQAQTLKRYPSPFSLTLSVYMCGSTMLALAMLLTVQDRSAWMLHTASDVISVVYSGILGSGLVLALQAWVIKKSGPMLAASYSPLNVFATTVVAYFFLGESIHLGSLLGVLLVINGLFFITWGKVQSERGDQQSAQNSPALDSLLIAK